MGGQLSIRCICCKGNDNFEEETEDKINVGEKIENYDDPHIKMPAFTHRSWSETTTLPAR
jgi:hypothetical protein